MLKEILSNRADSKHEFIPIEEFYLIPLRSHLLRTPNGSELLKQEAKMETQDREVDLIDLGAVSVETRGQLEIAEVDSDNQRFTPEALTAD
jgi:hypothetical protein